MNQSLSEALRSAPIFEFLSEKEISQVAQMSRIRKLDKREFLFMEGNQAGGFYLLLSGRIKVYKISPTGKEHVLHLVEPGQTFAEAAIFADDTYPAFAAAVEQSEVALIPKDDFKALMQKYPDLCMRMMGSLSIWLHRLVDIIDSLAFSDVESRMSSYLLRLNQRQEEKEGAGHKVDLQVEKSLLASYLGTTPETFSRVLRRFQDRGWIEVDGSKIIILDKDALLRLLDSA